MVKWQFDEEDARIVFLIKTMKKKYAEDTLKKGTFCFNFPDLFNSSSSLNPAQLDRWDSHSTSFVRQVMFAPIISDDENGICYGKPKLLAEEAIIHEISTESKQTPMCCFRRVLEDDLIDHKSGYILKLGNLVDRIKTEFGHDAYVLILRPRVMMERLGKMSSYFARRIHYGDKSPEYQEFLDTSDFEQAEMFQKDIAYAWQNEFRIILTPQSSFESKIIHIGSIEDIAIAGDIEELRDGLLIADEADLITSEMPINSDAR